MLWSLYEQQTKKWLSKAQPARRGRATVAAEHLLQRLLRQKNKQAFCWGKPAATVQIALQRVFFGLFLPPNDERDSESGAGEAGVRLRKSALVPGLQRRCRRDISVSRGDLGRNRTEAARQRLDIKNNLSCLWALLPDKSLRTNATTLPPPTRPLDVTSTIKRKDSWSWDRLLAVPSAAIRGLKLLFSPRCQRM